MEDLKDRTPSTGKGSIMSLIPVGWLVLAPVCSQVPALRNLGGWRRPGLALFRGRQRRAGCFGRKSLKVVLAVRWSLIGVESIILRGRTWV